MSETKQIAEMATKVSDEIFEVFKWSRKIVEDHSWDCVNSAAHGGKKDHPTDCVFYYRNPYDNEMVYVNTDLKSYAKKSISKSQIFSAIHSLSYATNCAPINPNWQNLFKPEDSYKVVGMLFVYNHCGTYAGDFDNIISEINVETNHLDSENMIYVVDPFKVIELHSIAFDIQRQIGSGELPAIEEFCYFHPNEMMTRNHFDQDYDEPATIEMLSSPWIIIKHGKSKKCKAGYLIYYTRKGSEVDEFVYLLDALSYYQILNNKAEVRIKLTNKSKLAALNLTTAIEQYFKNLGHDADKISEMTELMVKGTIAQVKPQFTAEELGIIG